MESRGAYGVAQLLRCLGVKIFWMMQTALVVDIDPVISDAAAALNRQDPHARMPNTTDLEVRLRNVEARYQGLLQAAVEGIIVIDDHGLIEAFSAGAERIFGYQATEAIGYNVSVLMPQPDAARHDGYITNFLRSRHAKIIGLGREVEGLRKSGARFPMDLAVGEVVTPEGTKFIGIVRDITRRKLAEEALRIREEELRLIVEHAPGGILTADLQGKIISVNPALSKLLQAAPAAVIGHPMSTLVEAIDRERLGAAMELVIAESRQVQVPHLHLQCGDGTQAQVVLHLGLITREASPYQLVGQVIDRTDEVRAQEATRRMQDEITHVARLTTLGEMASAIAHEINQPLTVIATQAQAYRRLMNNAQTTPAEIAAGLDTIAEQALRIGQVVKRVRAFVTRRESARERIDLNETITQVLDLAWVDARETHIPLEVDLAAALPLLIGDSVQLQQVVLNLLRNAIDVSQTLDDPLRVIRIATREGEAGVIISVTDRGPGVPLEQQPRLFLPFFTTKADGVGMGLWISHSIVDAHGGTLRYRDNPRGGAIFEVYLPSGGGNPHAYAEDDAR